jgi:shikimate dehydrogenase
VIAGSRYRAAILGHPVDHSLSPVLHRAAYAALGLVDWSYDRRDVTAEALPGFVADLGPAWVGLSLTMPLKQAIIPLLDHVEPLAAAVGAVNTVLVQHVGRSRVLVGANTDVHGMVTALREAAGPEHPVDGPAVVLGAGATAASAVAALGELGHPAPIVVARSPGRAGAVLRAASRMGVTVALRPWDRAPGILARAGVVVSTVPAGAADDLAAALVVRAPTPSRLLLDVVYEPWPTPLAVAWTAAGGSVAPGWAMLLHQAAEQVRLMTGEEPPLEAMREAVLGALAQRARGHAEPDGPGA